MILVAGATGLLGTEICRRLRGASHPVRALVRATAAPDKVEKLLSMGASTVLADLKDPPSLARACAGIEAVITTASSTLSRQEGDSIETVDRLGQLCLIDAAKNAAIRQFVHISIPLDLHYDCPLFRAKREVESAVEGSGMDYTVLHAGYFMEVWLSPALGFDYANGRVTLYGSGERPLSWVSYRDVAGFAVDSLTNHAAQNRRLAVAGLEMVTPREVVRVFENVSGRSFAVEKVPQEALEKQYAEAKDPMSRSFAALMLEYAHGCPMDVRETLQLMPRTLATVRDYAMAVRGSREKR
ncbi:MAG TPA: SDR family oxidoreductase [Bryobacteraceae bacterium]|nr:SDR family oxidoreductase [Bryobacteraceae bacterium]